MKIGKAISIELRDGQRLSLSLKETRELYRKLGKMLTDASKGGRSARNVKAARKKKIRIAGKRSRATSTKPSSSSSKIISLSDAKRQEILAHLNREISATPRTLTNLLKGVSYSAGQLPAIRSIIESQQGVRAKTKGKRTLYLKKKTMTTTAAAAIGTTRRARVKTVPLDKEAKSAVVEAPAATSSSTTTTSS
ncbi:hypothetical protein NTE_00273 [Candidatus Nitrososphaera evergladensis SR1]|uniref:Uncharacterized protein n=1 Tax=Candidatus Nitrososphaera evergladensis SR1 TaxID=1459636 RepID=A0A075MMJ3_9ARCH|nr:hypothetical protein [Candidatus Nitrososphaera evergladensis]AIF82355.1 hypothetical protein NTE_00273 [Candidatus Nitrososphaera evergladensis SR1]